MNIQKIQNSDIDTLKELQPDGWSDIRPYFYYYSASPFCHPIKIIDNGEIQAVGTTICNSETAWLAHIIVHPGHRNKGLGKDIVSALIENLDREKYRTIYLDATDMGYPVYKKIGFETETDYVHLDGSLTDLQLDDPASVIPFEQRYTNDLLALDKLVSGEDRHQVLQNHLVSALLFIREDKLEGAYFPTLFDGYILALNETVGTELMKLRMRTKHTARFPAKNKAAVGFLLKNNYTEIRTSKRMVLGEKREWKEECIFNRVSGGLG